MQKPNGKTMNNKIHPNRLHDDNLQLEHQNTAVLLLQKLGLEQYTELFYLHHIDDATFMELKDTDLESIGVSSLGHRFKIINGINSLKLEKDALIKEQESRLAKDKNKESGSNALWVTGSIGMLVGLIFSSDQNRFIYIIGGLLGAWILFIPTIIAFKRGHPHRVAISIVNLLFSFTGFVWIILLVYSMTSTNLNHVTDLVLHEVRRKSRH
jgi:hypothetical protein